ncbi:hypothetical protein LEL_10536 [Akanthomyces lecanii RCEF 1005]|uniref:Uncharacterized protein n=1 Tax=Akanthomyces lecanii RCEF 1005 TaxID=1081108 RepID=A0A167XKK6_CORDF|nr:hypothetical protein LEL_10536 [Akanthomyces lecanii RCEF 1005]
MSQHGLPTPPPTPHSIPIVPLEGNLFSQDGFVIIQLPSAQSNSGSNSPSEEAIPQQDALHYLTDACFSTFDFPHFHSGDFILDLHPGGGAYTEHMRERGFVPLKNKYEWSADQGLNIEPDFHPPNLIRCGGKPWILAPVFFEEIFQALAHGGHFLLEFADLVPPSCGTGAWWRYEDPSEDCVSQLSRLTRSENVRSLCTMLQAAGFGGVRVEQEILTGNHNTSHCESVYRSALDAYLRRDECYLGEETVENYYASCHERTTKLLDMLPELNSAQLNLIRITAQKPARG